jgi:bifunctional UDP-N-acetylglucosamine pyrophosphorylase/glucosamine-1-phosphate N-acetyltransferase
VLAKYVEDPSAFGVFMHTNGYVEKLIEKPKEKISNFANIGVYLLDESIFEFDLPLSPRGEFEITDYITYLATKKPMKIVEAQGQWLPVNSFEQKEFAEQILKYLEL